VTVHYIYFSLCTNDVKKCCIVVDAVRILNKGDFVNSGLIYTALGA